MPGDDLTHGPPATRKAGGSHHRFGRINRRSLRDGVTAYIALSPVTFAWLPPSSLRSLLLKNLAPASERQDHTTSPSASATFVSRALRVHRIPAPRIVTIGRNVPLHRGGMRESILVICPTEQVPRPAADWHDGQFAHGVPAEIARR